MQISIPTYARSNNILRSTKETHIDVYENDIIFTLSLVSSACIEDVTKWYMPTKKKLFYTLCTTYLDKIWKKIEHTVRRNEDFGTLRPKDELIRNAFSSMVNAPDSIWHVRLDNVKIVQVTDTKLKVQGSIDVVYEHDGQVEFYPLIMPALNAADIEPLGEKFKLMFINAEYHGIRG